MSKSKLHDVKTILQVHNYDVFVISESWLWKNILDNEVQIPGYNMLRVDRPNIKTYNKGGGGVLAYVKDDYTIKKQDNSFSHPEKVQSIQFKISKEYIKPILIIALYRVSDTPARFIDELENEITNNREKEIYVIGDLNMNQLSFKDNILRPFLIRTSMKQLIKQPTRITEESRSLIDVIMTTSPEYNKVSGVLRCSLSDHDIVYTVRKHRKLFNTRLETRTVRNFKNIDHGAVMNTIHSAPWWTLTDPKTNIDMKFNIYCEIIKINLNKHAPLTNVRVKTTSPVWMTKEYKLLLNKVNQLKTETLKRNSPEAWLQFRKHRNKCENLRSQLKLESFNEHIKNSSNKSKSAWRVLNSEIGKSTTHKPVQRFIVDDREVTTEAEIGDAFCKFFADISTTTREATLPNEDKLYHPNNRMDSDEISNEEVLRAIKFLKTNKPVGSDGIPAKFYKMYGQHISQILTDLFNDSLRNGTVPSILPSIQFFFTGYF
jgi:hypothetical protein